MQVIRPIRNDHLPQLKALAGTISGGLTSLPNDADFLEARINESLRSFDPKIRRAGDEYYLFVLEDTATRELLGTSGIHARVGGFDPFYSYEIRQKTFAHEPLGIRKQVAELHLKKTHKGPSEIGSLFLRADARGGGRGRLLSLSRFLFMAAFPKRFDTHVLAEMRGYIDAAGKAPFWESVGRHFFEKDYYTADFLSGLGNKDFIADLMPEHPIYITLLPAEVQAVIGRVHPETEPALALLHHEGFAKNGEVDIFDAGPLLVAELARIRTVADSRTARVSRFVDEPPAAAEFFVANRSLEFRCSSGAVGVEPDGTVSIARMLADALRVSIGDEITFSPPR
jgi:arginine N-succinyltransferase